MCSAKKHVRFRPTAAIIVRSATRWEHPDIPPEQRNSDIEAVAGRLADIEAELSTLRGSITDHDPPAPV
jgi:hypothetical protein